MKTIEITLYKFEELSESAQMEAIRSNIDINVNWDWWDWDEFYSNQYWELRAFDLDRGNYAELTLLSEWRECVDYIVRTFGGELAECAKSFVDRFDDSVSHICVNGRCIEGKEDEFEELLDAFGQEFEEYLSNEVLLHLKAEHDYLTSEEAIRETLISNDYDFTEDGEIY